MLLVTIVQDDPGLCLAVHGGGLLQHDRHHHQPLPARLHRGVQVQLCYDVLYVVLDWSSESYHDLIDYI